MNHILWSSASGVQAIICYIILPVWVYLAKKMSTASKRAMCFLFPLLWPLTSAVSFSFCQVRSLLRVLSWTVILVWGVWVLKQSIQGQIWSGWDPFQMTPGKGGSGSWSNILWMEKMIWWKAVPFCGSFIRQCCVRKPENKQNEK